MSNNERAKSYKRQLIKYLDMAKKGTLKDNDKQWLLLRDISDHIRYCNMIIARKFEKAARFQEELDTSSREMIPNTLYNKMYKYL